LNQVPINITVNRDSVISEKLSELSRKGYQLKFRRECAWLYCVEHRQWIMPEDITVDESFYFQEILNPDADRMLYAISLVEGVKGFLIDTCTVYMDNISHEMMRKLGLIDRSDEPIHERKKSGKVFSQ
jgi:hypothetical protein